MKKLTTLLIAPVFASLIVFMSCGPDDPPATPPVFNGVTIAELLAGGTWNTPNSVTNGNNDNVTGDWANFKLNFTVTGSDRLSGSYTSEGLPRTEFTAVWAAQGTWTINEEGTTITRNDRVTWAISGISANAPNTLNMVSSAITQSGRKAGINGSWSFGLKK